MEPVKITDNKEWSAIDIFLFSNGQQYSPPRKYHLRSEELQWWGTTMSYLGRTHYGSGHSSIELYAINGTKINGPLDLINGAAYVAVEPPDSFVNTGYEEYLLRASRSWEKRLAQKSFNTETSKSELKRGPDPVIQYNDTLNTPGNIADEALIKVGSNAFNTQQKSRPTKPYQRPQRKSITSPKQIQKKKSFDTHGAIIKRLCAETDKLVPCPKKPSINKNRCINQKPFTIVPRKTNETSNQDSSSCCKKRGSIKPETNSKIETSKTVNLNNTESIRKPQIIDLFSNNESEVMSYKNDQERYSIVHQSKHINEQNNLVDDNAAVQDQFTHRTKMDDGSNFEKDSSNKQINEYENSDLPLIPKELKNEIESDRKDKVPIINDNNIQENKSHDSLLNSRSEKQVIDEYVAQMNKGGILLLKLKVKLKDCKTIFNKNKSKDIPTATSLSNLPKTEKTSQVDINISFSGDLLKSNDQQYIQDKSLQSLLNKLYSEETDNVNTKTDQVSPRIIILQCACRDYSNKYKCCMCDVSKIQGCEVEDRKYEATLNENLNETRCECHTETFKTEAVKEANENRLSLSNGTRVKDLAQKFERPERIMSNYKNTNGNNRTMNENQRQSVVLTRLIGSQVEKSTINQIEKENNNQNSKSSYYNKATQTDWCNLMLEARHHEGDNYTFHLPSLYLLKQYNL